MANDLNIEDSTLRVLDQIEEEMDRYDDAAYVDDDDHGLAFDRLKRKKPKNEAGMERLNRWLKKRESS